MPVAQVAQPPGKLIPVDRGQRLAAGMPRCSARGEQQLAEAVVIRRLQLAPDGLEAGEHHLGGTGQQAFKHMIAGIDDIHGRISVLEQVHRFEIGENEIIMRRRFTVGHQAVHRHQKLLHPECTVGGLRDHDDRQLVTAGATLLFAEVFNEKEQRAGPQVGQACRKAAVKTVNRAFEAPFQLSPGDEHKQMSLADRPRQ